MKKNIIWNSNLFGDINYGEKVIREVHGEQRAGAATAQEAGNTAVSVIAIINNVVLQEVIRVISDNADDTLAGALENLEERARIAMLHANGVTLGEIEEKFGMTSLFNRSKAASKSDFWKRLARWIRMPGKLVRRSRRA